MTLFGFERDVVGIQQGVSGGPGSTHQRVTYASAIHWCTAGKQTAEVTH